jgi:pilus assembly protein Flp/PilA
VPLVEPGETRCTYREVALKRLFWEFLTDQSAATAIEYALIAGGISIAIVAVVNGLGTNLNTKYQSVSAALK